MLAGDVVVALVVLTLAQEARQLGCDRVARWKIVLVDELVDAALEVVDVRRGLFVRRDGLADLQRIRIGGLVELRRVDVRAEQLA